MAVSWTWRRAHDYSTGPVANENKRSPADLSRPLAKGRPPHPVANCRAIVSPPTRPCGRASKSCRRRSRPPAFGAGRVCWRAGGLLRRVAEGKLALLSLPLAAYGGQRKCSNSVSRHHARASAQLPNPDQSSARIIRAHSGSLGVTWNLTVLRQFPLQLEQVCAAALACLGSREVCGLTSIRFWLTCATIGLQIRLIFQREHNSLDRFHLLTARLPVGLAPSGASGVAGRVLDGRRFGREEVGRSPAGRAGAEHELSWRWAGTQSAPSRECG